MGNVVLKGNFTKVATATQTAYGFAYVSKKGGAPVVDHSGDTWDIDKVRETAHEFVSECREGGEMHITKGGAELVESLVFDQDVQDALGIQLMKDGEPIEAWFVGFRITDPALLEKVQKGELSMFSIGGTGKREEL